MCMCVHAYFQIRSGLIVPNAWNSFGWLHFTQTQSKSVQNIFIEIYYHKLCRCCHLSRIESSSTNICSIVWDLRDFIMPGVVPQVNHLQSNHFWHKWLIVQSHLSYLISHLNNSPHLSPKHWEPTLRPCPCPYCSKQGASVLLLAFSRLSKIKTIDLGSFIGFGPTKHYKEGKIMILFSQASAWRTA